MCDSLPFHPKAAEPPCDIRIDRFNDTSFPIVTWNEPTSGATPTGYVVYLQIDGEKQIHVILNGHLTSEALIAVNSTELMYTITVVALSDMLPSKPTFPVYGKT